MKNGRILMVAAIAAAAMTQARTSESGITGTLHDMSAKSWNTSKTLCGVCHVAHNAIAGQPALWNHKLSTVASYTVYTSPTMQATAGQPGTYSKLCLSCHDGTVALENFGGVTTGTNFVLPANNVGSDLSNDHPIGITYDTALSTSDGALYDPATKLWGGTPSGTINAMMLFSGKMECASCHDVHDNTNTYFLRRPNAGSALCLVCHNK